MREITIAFLFLLFSSANSEQNIFNVTTIKEALQSRIPQITDVYMKVLLERVKLYLPAKQTFDGDSDLTSEMIIKALDNLRDVLPESIPLFPYVTVEPTTNNILVYFATYDSVITNLTQFDTNASVSNTAHCSSVNISIVVDTSLLGGHYELDVSGSDDMHIYGDGNYRIATRKTVLNVSTKVQIHEDGSFLMTDFLADMSVNSTKIELDNLLDNDQTVDPLVDFMGQMVPEEMAAISGLLQDTLNTTVVYTINSSFAKIISWNTVVFLIKLAAGYYT